MLISDRSFSFSCEPEEKHTYDQRDGSVRIHQENRRDRYLLKPGVLLLQLHQIFNLLLVVLMSDKFSVLL